MCGMGLILTGICGQTKKKGARKGGADLKLDDCTSSAAGSLEAFQAPLFVCEKQPHPSLQIAHNGDNFIQTKKVSDHRERENMCRPGR